MLTFPPDFSFVVQLISFCILWFGLKRLAFDPFVQVLEARAARTTGVTRAAEEIKAAAGASAAEYERRLHEVRGALVAETAAAHAAIQSEEQKILAEVRTQASADLVRLRDSLSREAAGARSAIATEAGTLSSRILERVIGRSLA